MTLEQLDLFPSEELSLEVSPARISPSPEKGPASPESDQDSSGKSFDFLMNFIPSGSSSKMSLVSCQLTEDGIWQPSSKRWLTSGMASPGECWTLSTSESPKDVVESSLSAILEIPGEHLRKYFLSPRACTGILRRAAKRSRKLPDALQSALESVAARLPE
jgi:hypothetical protein